MPECPDCGKTDHVVQLDDGENYACQECGDIFDKYGRKIP